MARTRLPFLRLIKGRYWYFRSVETGNVRVRGNPSDPKTSLMFWRAYSELIKERETTRAWRKARAKAKRKLKSGP